MSHPSPTPSAPNDKKALLLTLSTTAAFAVATLLLWNAEFYYLGALTLACLALTLFVVRFDYLLFCIALLTPFAIDIELLPQAELSFPVEPLMIVASGIFLFRALLTGRYDRRILRHPISLALLAMLAWMLVSACFSQMPLVSFKYWISRLWFVIPFFFAAVPLFSDRSNIMRFFWCYVAGLSLIIVYSTINTFFATGSLAELQVRHVAMKPFYNDHTAYGCILALMLPAATYSLFGQKGDFWRQALKFVAVALLCLGLFLSYCRAAWVSVAAAACMYVLLRMGVKMKWMAAAAVLAVGVFFAFQGEIMQRLERNHQDSSYEIGDQIKSITNVATDASNLERLNRWGAAFRLWADHPVTGSGPGTYQFLYASYQRSYQLSVISTDFGDNGNAHSEYIGPLTEQGIPGPLLVIALFGVTFATGVRIYRTSTDRKSAALSLCLTLCLLTYYIHGFFNNFLDTDKLSVPFWAFTAAIVALDLYGEQQTIATEESSNEAQNSPN